ncbi:uncharacterized protein LOC128891697 isoform X1 [Hylaeus anthracinus]|uniref:uncharacterized protein LOC128891697 isoform X1 n=1 Tax=Hylaeus anthracinus TaxID=313031 RepID=UPI0023B9854F|nr:uncharacterized protein LOC128891697 isoform X1 [Hylaeus anthracinus]XP_054007386.1 uncharacterized protein LOC128891697 isoform X1 [Hylaeus anthracinus]XP_054007387.1 uncharacterized protein LOC128891697 isoform X1 [Hylaeus anthracinus]XP_054007388.1 uncharacterized protein LOC128891697 isoform X1 [Hylaeus anthracinus]
MALLERNTSVNPLTRKDLVRNIKARVKPFDVETTFVELNAEKKNRGKKYRGPDSPLYSAIYPLVCIMKVFGLAPYDFAGDRMTVSNICLVLSLAFLVLYSYIIYMVYLRFIDTKRDKSIVAVVETVKVIVNYLVAMYELVSTVFSRRSFLRIWNALQDLDERLASLGYPLKETKTKIAVWALLVIQTVVWTIINLSGIYAYSEKWSFNVSYMCIYLGTTMSVYKFAGMTFFVGQRFHQLNRMARENLPPKIGYKSTTISRKTIQDLHNELMLTAELLNSIYSWSLFFWLGNLSVHSVSNLYFIIDWVILSPWSKIPWRMICNMWFWLVAFITQLVALHIGCDYASTEANSMGAIVLEWDARVIKRFPHDDSVRTSLHFLNRRLRFNAGGLFDINLPLLCSIVGVLSTYLVILLQFPA